METGMQRGKSYLGLANVEMAAVETFILSIENIESLYDAYTRLTAAEGYLREAATYEPELSLTFMFRHPCQYMQAIRYGTDVLEQATRCDDLSKRLASTAKEFKARRNL